MNTKYIGANERCLCNSARLVSCLRDDRDPAADDPLWPQYQRCLDCGRQYESCTVGATYLNCRYWVSAWKVCGWYA